MVDNAADVIAHAQALGFLNVTSDKLRPGSWLRFRVDGIKQLDAGRIKLSEITLKNGRRVYVGVIGVYSGAEFIFEKIDLSTDKDKYGSSKEERKQIAEQVKAAQQKAELAEKAAAVKAAKIAEKKYHACKPAEPTTALYLAEKRVNAYDIRMTSDGAAVVAMRGRGNQIVALQFLMSRSILAHKEKINKIGSNKRIWPKDCKWSGAYHWIGGIPRPGDVIVVAEGYATAASIHAATGLICVVAFSAGNLKPVVMWLAENYPSAYILIMADDDNLKQCPVETCRHRFMLSRQPDDNCPACGQPHRRKNDGVNAALKAVVEVEKIAGAENKTKRAYYLIPRWTDQDRRLHEWVKHGNKRTDANDLCIDEGEAALRIQIEAFIADLRIRLPSHAQPVLQTPVQDNPVRRFMVRDLHEALARFKPIADGGDITYDMLLCKAVKNSDVRNQFSSREVYRRWQEAVEPDKQVITMDDIGLFFEPEAINKPGNGWRGFATKPIQNDSACALIDKFIRDVICGGNQEHYHFLMCCIALPIQKPGTKIQVGVIIQSGEGYGKGLFGQIVVRPYGRHGIELNQNDLEDRFNAHMQDILVCVYEEIGAHAGADRHKLKNLLKHMVTGKTTRINPKQINGKMHINRTNYFFFTNELLAFLLGNQARRWFVLMLKTQKDKAYYKKVAAQIESEEGANAWHYRLENYPIGGFTGHEEPPTTQGKEDMLDISKDYALQFWDEFISGFLPGIPIKHPILTEDLSELFFAWCKKQRITNPPVHKVFIAQVKRLPDVIYERTTYTLILEKTVNGVVESTETVSDQGRFIYPPNCVDVPTKGKAEALGKYMLAFRSKLKDYSK